MAPNVAHCDNIAQWQTTTTKPFQWPFQQDIAWKPSIFYVLLHVAAINGIYLSCTSAKTATNVFTVILYYMSFLGVTSGVHRLWSHRAYEAKLPLRVFLMVMNTMSMQGTIYAWARDHRVHHKHTDTDADPHNSRRGFFYSHWGWLMLRKLPEVIAKGNTVDLSDLKRDPVVMFQRKYYVEIMLFWSLLVPTLVPCCCWGETLRNTFYVAIALRYCLTLHGTGLINSAAHMWGSKPYDKSMYATENYFVSICSTGEGWHNYHHVFPWDYKARELSAYSGTTSTAFIDLMAWVGQAYNLKTAPAAMVEARVGRTGDGSHEVWGWGDKDMAVEDRRQADVINRRPSRLVPT